uniref:Uncharacterized protein n=1 Tax=Steinernema glaseri TaxID=37863 RepID=A0A1I7YRW8_9BILA
MKTRGQRRLHVGNAGSAFI